MDNNALFKIGYGLYVVTTNTGEKDNGCILNTTMQVTSNPVQIAIAVNKNNYTEEIIKTTNKFNICVLAEGTKFDVFKRFGFQCGRDINKFEGFNDVQRAKNGLLYLTKNTNAYLSASVDNIIELGSHTMFIAKVDDAEILSDTPTVTYDFYQKNIKPKPQKVEKHGWRCKTCGYIYEGDELPSDFICPWCKHGVDDFERI